MIDLESRHKIVFSKKASLSIESYLNRADTNEIAIGIIKNGSGYYTSKGISEKSLFDIGSISKTFTAQIILNLAEEGKLDLDDTVDSYLSLKRGQYPKIRQLLTHTAGYRHLTPVEITLPHLMTKGYSRKNVYRGIDSSRVLSALSRRNHAKSSNRYHYSDFSYAILALVAEKILCKPFSEIMNQWLLEECGLENTYAHPVFDRVPIYGRFKKIKAWEWEKNNPYMAGGGIVSSLEDMMRFANQQILSEKNYILSSQSVYELSFSDKSDIGTCLGWHTYKKSDQLWHVGGVGLFRASVIINRKRGCAVVVLGNAKGGKSANVHYLAKLLYGDLKRNKTYISKD